MLWLKTLVAGKAWVLPGVLLIALAALWSYHWVAYGVLQRSYEKATAMIGELRTDVSSKAAQITKLSESLKAQNDAVDRLVQASVARTDAANAAIRQARAQEAKWRGKYNDILNTPPPSEDDCQALGITMEAYLEARRKEYLDTP